MEAARQHQRERFNGTDTASNADMRPAQIRKFCVLDEECQALMKPAMRQLLLTARAYHRVLKLSRTIADLAGSDTIAQVHLAEALQCRPKIKCVLESCVRLVKCGVRQSRFFHVISELRIAPPDV